MREIHFHGFFFMLVGCGEKNSTGVYVPCIDTEQRLTPMDSNSDGVSVQELIESIPARLQGTLTYSTGEETSLQIQIDVDDAAIWETVSIPSEANTSAPENCRTRQEIQANMMMQSDDEKIQETISMVFVQYKPNGSSTFNEEWYFNQSLFQLQGALNPEDYIGNTEMFNISYTVGGAITDRHLEGGLDVIGDVVYGDEDIVKQVHPVASMSAVEE